MAMFAVAMVMVMFFVVYARHGGDSTAVRLMYQSA
jgi:hypothetical protein